MNKREQEMKFNIDKHIEKMDNDYDDTKQKKRYEAYNNDDDGDIPEEFKHFTN